MLASQDLVSGFLVFGSRFWVGVLGYGLGGDYGWGFFE